MTNHMTPTEQDEELREAIIAIVESEYKSPNYTPAVERVDHIMQLITADRKRVALEARLQEVEVSIIELERSDDPKFYSKDEAIRSQRARYTKLEGEIQGLTKDKE